MAKLITVLCVIYCHALTIATPVSDVFNFFIMPSFFIVYGLSVGERQVREGKWVKFIASKARSLLVPYLLWAMVYSGSVGRDFFWNVFIGNNPSLGRAGTNAVLWFLPCMFVATILFQVYSSLFLSIKSRNLQRLYALGAVIGCAVVAYHFNGFAVGGRLFGWDIALLGCAFMIIGSRIANTVERLRSLPRVLKLILAIGCMTFTYYPFASNSIAYNARYGQYYTSMAIGFYGRIDLFIVGATVGTLGVLLISMMLERFSFLAWLGQYSLFYMGVHYILFYHWLLIAWCNEVLAFENGTIFRMALAAVITFVVCIPLCGIVNWACPALNGKSVKNLPEFKQRPLNKETLSFWWRSLLGVLMVICFFAVAAITSYYWILHR